ncbi:MAG: hypothetical protein AAF438_08090 [Pseudomonadota bacterium]
MKKILLLLVSVLAVIVFFATRLISNEAPNSLEPSSDLESPSEDNKNVTANTTPQSASEIQETQVKKIPEFVVGSETEALDMLSALGIDDTVFQQQLVEWGVDHGVSIGWQVDVKDFLDQPYHQYDDATLKGLAEDGSMWAQQILGGRWFNSRPAEAQELFRQATARGSLQAAASLANLYHAVATRSEDSLDIDPGTLEQIYSLNDSPNSPELMSYAWTVVEEKMWRAPVTPRTTLSDGEIEQACQLADALYDDLRGIRMRHGLGELEVPDPPMFMPYLLGKVGSGCYKPDNARDVSHCKGARITGRRNSDSQAIWFCVE